MADRVRFEFAVRYLPNVYLPRPAPPQAVVQLDNVNMSTEVIAFLSKQQGVSPPEIAPRWAKLEEYYNKRLWHQLTVELLALVKVCSFLFVSSFLLLNRWKNVRRCSLSL